VGAEPKKIAEAFEKLIDAQFNEWPELYGDGKAAESIAAEIYRLIHG
jgi:hypothetical protein